MQQIKDNQDFNKKSETFSLSYKTHVDPFGDNAYAHRAYNKAEKIVSVLYLLTKNVNDEEPIRSSIRALCHVLLERVLLLRHGFRSSQKTGREDVDACIRELMTAIRLLTLSEYVSMQNGQLTIEALEDLASFLRQAQNSFLSEHVFVRREDFVEESIISPQAVLQSEYKNTSKKTLESIGGDEAVGISIGAPREHKRPNIFESGVHARHNSRQEIIISVLRKNGPLGIKEIASHLNDCGEKTVQRELSTLVARRILAKVGEKRWSKYIIR